MKITKSSLVNFLLQALLLSTLIFTIAYFIVGYLSVPSVDIEPLRDWKFIYENKVLLLYAIINGILLILLFFNISNGFKISYVVFFAIGIFLLSLLLNRNFPPPMYYFSVLNVYIVFYVLLRSEIKNAKMSNITLWIFICYIVSPILIEMSKNLIDITNHIPPLFVFDSFRGFTFDRIEYGIMAGYLLLILNAGEKKYTLSVVPFVIFGILIAESRAIMVALFLTYIYLLRHNTKSLFSLTFGASIIYLIFVSISNREELLSTDGGRFDFYFSSLIQIFNSPLSILFGSGEFYTPVEKYNVVPHNLIFQTLLNFGIFVFIVWFLIIVSLWNRLNDNGRAFLIYALVLGFFHPGYDGFMFLPFSALGYYLAIFYGLSYEGQR